MKRILIITIITCLLIPFFSINSYAASYDLGDPVYWYQVGRDPGKFPLALRYTNGVLQNVVMPINLSFYKDGYDAVGNYDYDFTWRVGGYAYYESAEYKVRASNLDTSKNVLAMVTNDSVRNTMLFPGIAYENIYFPNSNDVFKIEFSIDTLKLGTSGDIPSVFNEYLKPEYLCFFQLMSSSGADFPLHVPFSSVVVSPSNNGRILTYTYYFNAYGEIFNVLKSNSEGSLLRLVIRFPYYFGNSTLLDNGVFALTNADLPTSYSIFNPSGYTQELEKIEHAIISSNENLINFYETMTEEDVAVIVHGKAQNDKLNDSIKDYDKVQSGINDIVDKVELPSVNIQDANSSFVSSGIGDFSKNNHFWSVSVITMVVITFTFGTLSLILFGKKG